MKKSSLILVIIFLFTMGFNQVSVAQEKNKEKDKELQEAIDAQKKAMVEQKKAQEEAQKEARKDIEESRDELERVMEDIKVTGYKDQDKIMRVYRDMNNNRPWTSGESYVFTPGIEFYGSHFGGDTERTTWEFSKYVKETSFSRDYTFDVEPTVNTVVMAVNGDCKSGEIRIKIVMPNGKTYSDIVIDEFGNLNWRKSFTISETENKDKTGAWKFEINSSKASGYFKISLQTY
jgi:hypothetical protein